MHLVVAAHDFYPDPGSGGTGRYVYETGRALVDRGHSVTVITRRRGDVPVRETVGGIDVYRYDIDVYGAEAPDAFAQVPDAAAAVADHVEALGDPDLVSFQGPVTAALVDATVPDAVPRSCTFHSPWPAEYAIKTRTTGSPTDEPREFHVRLRATIEQHVLDRATAAVTLSKYMREQLRETYDDPPPTAVVPGGVDADRFRPDAGPTSAIAASDTAVLTVRRMTPRMGHDRLLTAFADVADERPNTHLYLAGDGPIREDLEALAADFGIADRTTFLGYVSEADLPATYADADVFVLPTRELEGFGLATLEALAAGTPAVGTAVGATPELLEPLECADAVPMPLVVADDGDALARRIRRWASVDDRALAEAGEACRSYVRREYTWERTADRLLDQYESLVG
jgi:glycosyltransferase involved in cell wall biosynthesis